jgi:hypothetical protein
MKWMIPILIMEVHHQIKDVAAVRNAEFSIFGFFHQGNRFGGHYVRFFACQGKQLGISVMQLQSC